MSIRAVFFDLDGTLLDTAPDLSNALNKLLESKGKESISEEAVRKVVSDGAYAMIKLAFGVDRDHPDMPELRQSLLDFYLEDLSSGTTIYPGLSELIEELNSCNIHWGIVTNKPNTYAEPLMQCFEFATDPICLICPDHVTQRKPHPEPLELACTYANCEKEAAIYVGDHVRDIQCGQNAGIKTIAVSYGYISHGEDPKNWGADHVVDHGQAIWPIINTYLNA